MFLLLIITASLLIGIMRGFYLPAEILLVIYLFFTVRFIIKNRGDNLFCFETLFFIVQFVIIFFADIFLSLFDTISSTISSNLFADVAHQKSVTVQVLAALLYILGATISERKVTHSNPTFDTYFVFRTRFDFSSASFATSVIVFLCLVVLFLIGDIFAWFRYENSGVEFDNSGIVYLTILCLVSTVIEFTSLSNKRIKSLKGTIKSINKLYLFSVLISGVLMLLSGNRNEALLVLIPVLICYSIFIQRISNAKFLLMMGAGLILMVLIGLTRDTGVSSTSMKTISIDLYSFFQDFAPASICCDYLIEYTDQKGPILFGNAFLVLASAVPFLGGIVKNVFGLDYVTRSPEMTTEGMQLSNNMDSGLGTNLVGDVYYTGGLIFVVIFFLFFGLLMGKTYKCMFVDKQYSIFLLINYVFCTANAIYYTRAEWTMPFRYVGFSFLIIAVFWLFFHKNDSKASRLANPAIQC